MRNLKQLCSTRWIERHDSVRAFVELLEPLLNSLEGMSRWNDCKMTTKAQIINNSICKCDFLIRLFVIDSV